MHSARFAPALWSIRLARIALPLGLAMGLAACETPLNTLRVSRFATTQPTAPSVEPRAMALALTVSPDDLSLTPASVKEANALLNSQGRLSSQILTLTPFSAKGEQMAPRLAAVLRRSGAPMPIIRAKPADKAKLAEAERQGWDLELQSEAMVLTSETCLIAQPDKWMLQPYDGVGALGCANRSNIARMASDTRDLRRPRILDGGNGAAAAAAVDRYQKGEIRDLIDIDFKD